MPRQDVCGSYPWFGEPYERPPHVQHPTIRLLPDVQYLGRVSNRPVDLGAGHSDNPSATGRVQYMAQTAGQIRVAHARPPAQILCDLRSVLATNLRPLCFFALPVQPDNRPEVDACSRERI